MIPKEVVIIPSEEFKLKRPKKEQIMIDLEKLFKFKPSKIVIRLAPSRTNAFIIGAVDEEGVTDIAKQTKKRLARERKLKNESKNS